MKNTVKIVFVIIASIIGAGFASGKEIYSFFLIYGKCGFIGILLSNLIISFVIYKVLAICKINNITSYFDFCNYIVKNNKRFSLVLNNIVNIFLLISFLVMVVGFASLLEQEFKIFKLYGAFFIIVINYFFSMKRAEGVIKLSNCLIPILFIILLVINLKNNSFENLFFYLCDKEESVFVVFKITNNWLVKSVLYASYNCVVIVPILVLLSQNMKDKSSIMKVSIINFFVLSFFSLSIFILLLNGNDNLFQLEIPAIVVIAKFGTIYKYIYVLSLIISIITSVVSASLGFLNNISTSSKKFQRNLICISLLAIPFSFVSFGNLVSYLYPVMGLVGVVELVCISNS